MRHGTDCRSHNAMCWLEKVHLGSEHVMESKESSHSRVMSGRKSRVELLPYLINRLAARMNQVWLEKMRTRGLTTPRWQVLSILSAIDGCRIGTIADLSGHEQPVISRIIDQMERDGLVKRRPGEKGRAVEVWVTARGRTLYKELLPEAVAIVNWILRDFTESEAQIAARIMERLIESIESPRDSGKTRKTRKKDKR